MARERKDIVGLFILLSLAVLLTVTGGLMVLLWLLSPNGPLD
jgi:hypothetical protein